MTVGQAATQPQRLMNRDNMPYVGVGCIVEYEGRLLLVRNRRNRWSTPGGLLDYGETPAAAAARETLEETGVVVRSAEFFALTNDVIEEVGRHYITIWMKCQPETTNIVIGDAAEIVEAGWFEPSAIPQPRHLFFENLLAGRTVPSPPLGTLLATVGSR
jgi:8-oxo-dGTP diphosphatase